MTWTEKLSDSKTRRSVLLELRDQDDLTDFFQELEENENYFLRFLDDEDSKVRKLFSTVLARTQQQKYRDLLLNHYLDETQRMICPSLLKNLNYFDLSDVLETLETREKELINLLDTDMNKHIKEELRVLRQILKPYRVLPKHTFIGLKRAFPMILTIASGHQEALMDELAWLETKKVNLGVQVKTQELEHLLQNHLFSSIYFPLCKVSGNSIDDFCSISVIKKVLRFLDETHSGDFAYRLRVDHEDPKVARAIAEQLERKSESKLENHPMDYEVEMRIRTNKNGEGVIYLKLMTLPDHRFDYRQRISSSSLNGYTASLIAHYLQDYVQPEGQVIDPLCNDGTLLIERCYTAHPHFVMGLDMNSDLMEMAKQNAQQAGADIRFVQRDIRTFTHRRRFDELLTQLPTIVSKENQETVTGLYRCLFDKIPELVSDLGIAAFYSSESHIIQTLYQKRRHYLALEKKIPIRGKNYLYIFRVRANV